MSHDEKSEKPLKYYVFGTLAGKSVVENPRSKSRNHIEISTLSG